MLSFDVSKGIDEFKVLSMVRDRRISLTMRDQFMCLIISFMCLIALIAYFPFHFIFSLTFFVSLFC